MNNSVYSLGLLLAAVTAGSLVYLVALFIIKRQQKIKFLTEVQIFFDHLRAPVKFLIPAVCLLSVRSFLRLPPVAVANFSRVLDLWIIGNLGWLLLKAVNAILDVILKRYDIQAADNLKARRIHTQIDIVRHISSVVIVLVTIAFMLMTSAKVRQIGVSLLASAGVMGIILGFAAQKTLGNFIAGIQLAFAQPIRIDDVVIVENEWGWIEEITLTYVVVRIWDLRRLVVPISYFIEKPFQNWTRISSDILGTVFVYADYTVPVQEIREELSRILQASPHWDGKVDVLQVTNTTDRIVELRALMSAKDSPEAWNLRCEVREKLLEFMQNKFPQCLPRTRIAMEKERESSGTSEIRKK